MVDPNEPVSEAPERPRSPAHPGHRDTDSRDIGNVIALAFLAMLVLGGVWLFNALQSANDELNCVASGRRNCQTIP